MQDNDKHCWSCRKLFQGIPGMGKKDKRKRKQENLIPEEETKRELERNKEREREKKKEREDLFNKSFNRFFNQWNRGIELPLKLFHHFLY